MDLIDDLPEDLLANVRSMCGRRGEEWLSSLPELIRMLEKHWDVNVGTVYAASGINYVAPAETDRGELCVVKICPPYDNNEWLCESAYLRSRNGRACVRLIAEHPEYRAMLIERAVPGLTMDVIFAGREPECVAPAAKLLQYLIAGTVEHGMDSIDLDAWFENLHRSEGTRFPFEYAEKALKFYSRLRGSNRKYLHGDFHPRNIVNATRELFLMIDPKGIVGDVGYEIAVFLNNFHWWQRDRPDITNRLTTGVCHFADALGLTETEVREWAFAQMVVSAWWTFDELPDQYNNEVADADVWGV